MALRIKSPYQTESNLPLGRGYSSPCSLSTSGWCKGSQTSPVRHAHFCRILCELRYEMRVGCDKYIKSRLNTVHDIFSHICIEDLNMSREK